MATRRPDDAADEVVAEHAAKSQVAAIQVEIGAAEPREVDAHQRFVGAVRTVRFGVLRFV